MDLDDKQLSAVNHNFEAMLVLAGPGSGKTATITHRAARMIKAGVDPDALLLVTFSKKAANEMRERVALLTDDASAERAAIHTFHALGDKIIKAYPEACERQFGFTILDEGDQRGLFVRVLKEQMKVDKPGKLPYRQWLAAYSRLGQDGGRAVESEHAQAFGSMFFKHAGIERQDQMNWLWQAFAQYERYKRAQNVVDFDDLIILPTLAMQRDPSLGKSISDRHPMVTVDEAQDTNSVQYDMVRQISQHTGNMMLVGDDDQTIYTWRGASIDNIKRFQADFSPSVVRLEQNYRSTDAIIRAAAQHIQHNSDRMQKKPFSTREATSRPSLAMFPGDREMSRHIVARMQSDHAKGVPWDQMAVLYRKNRVGAMLEPALMEAGIPYQVQGGVKLTERKEVKLAVALARLVNNPRDQMAFMQLAKDIKFFGERGLDKHVEEARAYHDGHLTRPTASIKKVNVRDRMEKLDAVCEGLRREGPEALIDALLDDWGIDDHFPDDKPEQMEARGQRLATFKAWIGDALNKAGADENPWQVMQRVLLEDPEADLAEHGTVTLSTAHRAKGQEFSSVHIAGFSDGMMPMRGKGGEIENIEEERRTSYVAMTRAADNLYLYHADRLFLGYEALDMEPSPFLKEFEHDIEAVLPVVPQKENEQESGFSFDDSWVPSWAN